MWDENKFFDDFVKSADGIKPDDSFVNDLKLMVSDSGSRVVKMQSVKRLRIIRYSVIVAVFMIFGVVITIVHGSMKTFSGQKEPDSSQTIGNTAEVHAGNDDEGIYIGTIGEESEIDRAIRLLEGRETEVKDDDGENVKRTDRRNLLDKLANARQVTEGRKLKDLADDTDYETYIVTAYGKESMTIKVYQSGYIVINDKALYRE